MWLSTSPASSRCHRFKAGQLMHPLLKTLYRHLQNGKGLEESGTCEEKGGGRNGSKQKGRNTNNVHIGPSLGLNRGLANVEWASHPEPG